MLSLNPLPRLADSLRLRWITVGVEQSVLGEQVGQVDPVHPLALQPGSEGFPVALHPTNQRRAGAGKSASVQRPQDVIIVCHGHPYPDIGSHVNEFTSDTHRDN